MVLMPMVRVKAWIQDSGRSKVRGRTHGTKDKGDGEEYALAIVNIHGAATVGQTGCLRVSDAYMAGANTAADLLSYVPGNLSQ